MAATPDEADFLDEVRAASNGKAKGCSMRPLLAEILAGDRGLYQSVQAALTAPADQVTNVAIASVLTRRGFPVQPFVVGRHRKGECTCKMLPDLEA